MRAILPFVFLTAPAFGAPPEVAVGRPVERVVFDHADYAGRTEASTTVQIRSRTDGAIDKVLFKEGSAVKRGDVLFQLDDRLQRAEAAKAEAELRRAEAHLKGSELDLARLSKLADAKAISREELEKAAASVEEAKAALLAARAALEVARIGLEFTRIVSPIAGRVGRATAAAGNVVRGPELLATVYATDPLYVTFDLDEATLLRLERYTRVRKADRVTVGVNLSGDKGFPHKAVVDFLDPVVNPKAGTVRVRALFPNPAGDVRPGQFAGVRVQLGDARKALVIPEAALGRGNDREFVLVIGGKNVLEERTVRVVPADYEWVEVEAGLKPGERIVTDPRRHKAGEEVRPKPAEDPPAGPGGLGLASPPAPPVPGFPGGRAGPGRDGQVRGRHRPLTFAAPVE